MPISLPDARQLSDEVLQALRLRAIRGCELGYTETEVAELLGLARETVSRWWSAYAESGEQALPGDRTGRPVGSGRTLNDGQAAWLRTILVGKQPEDVGISSPLWTREAVPALIQKEYGIDMPVRTVGEYLQRWGFTPKAPRRHSRDQDPEEVRRWLDETYPAIERRAAREGAEVLWCDETGAAADHLPRRGYSREGHPGDDRGARLAHPDEHGRGDQQRGLGPLHDPQAGDDGGAVHHVPGAAARRDGGEGVPDRGPAAGPCGDDAGAWVAAHRERIELFFLPPTPRSGTRRST